MPESQSYNLPGRVRGVLGTAILLLGSVVAQAGTLEADWNNPPTDARVRAYWWWLNGNVTREAITHDLEQMKAKGFGGALICDADGSSQDGNERVPHGPTFFSPEWRELFKHTLREADRLGLEMSLNIQSGWNLGGPMVKAEDAPKKLTWSETLVTGRVGEGTGRSGDRRSNGTGGGPVSLKLGAPACRDNFYRDLFVLAYPRRAVPKDRKPLQNQREKSLQEPLKPFSAPDSTPLFQEFPATPGEEDARAGEVLDLSAHLTVEGAEGAEGVLNWDAPAGEWQVIRLGYTLNDHCRVSTCSEGWDGYALDPFDDGAFTRYWDAVVEPLIADAGPLAGKSLKYLHTDSWEVEVANWTPKLREEFQKRRGYDLLPWLPVIAGKIINSRDESNRFLHDFRRTIGDLAIDHHYRLFKERAHAHGLAIHPESGGPHAVPVDAQQCLGFNDAPMSEFWAWSWRHRIGDENRFFVKQPASAAHTYGRKLVLAEGFTTIGPHWQETLWDNLKPSFDHALTEGLNLLVWHAWVCSPASAGLPGQQYFAGTHLNPNVTWWEKSAPFFAYLNRCQAMLQQGIPVADVAYYHGDGVPNFARLRKSDPANLGSRYDYDVVTEEVLLNRMSVKDGQFVLPEGVSYRVLVLADRDVISLPVLRKLEAFAAAGAAVVGPKPKAATGLKGYPASDEEVKALADKLWDSGRIADLSALHATLKARNTPQDFLAWHMQPTNRLGKAQGGKGTMWIGKAQVDIPPYLLKRIHLAELDYVHRRAGDADIYFVANRTTNAMSTECLFGVAGKVPELWDAVSGKRRIAAAYEFAEGTNGGLTTVPLDFGPCGSWFVVFRTPTTTQYGAAKSNSCEPKILAELGGSWTVAFDPKWGGPASAEFDSLVSWTERPEPGIQFYSGTATYTKHFELPEAVTGQRPTTLLLDLGVVRELAEVKVNGKSCGITWTPPFRVDITEAVKPGTNTLEVDVVNFWPNRIIGDAREPAGQRLTRTNIRKLNADSQLMVSGLLGPVRLQESMPLEKN